ncbi:MAG: HEPN domain-containing protein [Saprospiraceae bacterium]|nr:HEPN domain-containing protein [Saprospiraceae bacterium]
MKEHTREDLIHYRIERARETLEEVETLIELRFWNTAVNRLYYACFYAVSALLLQENIKAQTHAGVRQMLGLHFIQTNKLSRDLGRFYSDLYDKRQTGDYDDFVEFDEATVLDLLQSAREFVTAVKSLIAM